MSEAVKQAAVNTAPAGERKKAPLWKRLLFSDVLLFRPISHKLAYIGVMAALCIAVNTFEIKFADTQLVSACSRRSLRASCSGRFPAPSPYSWAITVERCVGCITIGGWRFL